LRVRIIRPSVVCIPCTHVSHADSPAETTVKRIGVAKNLNFDSDRHRRPRAPSLPFIGFATDANALIHVDRVILFKVMTTRRVPDRGPFFFSISSTNKSLSDSSSVVNLKKNGKYRTTTRRIASKRALQLNTSMQTDETLRPCSNARHANQPRFDRIRRPCERRVNHHVYETVMTL